MRYVFGFGFAFALSLALMAGCGSDESGQGGTGGTGGTGGVGGDGGGGGSACRAVVDTMIQEADPSRYELDLNAVARVRNHGSLAWQETQDLCADRLAALGFGVERQEFDQGVNVIGRLPGTGDEELIISAHYDAVTDCPGADDNASGVAGVLEAARLLSASRYDRTLVVACWDQEEAGLVGSRAYADRANQRGIGIAGMYSLEMIGYVSDEPNSQRIPAGFDLLFAEQVAQLEANEYRGDFITIVTDTGSRTLNAAFEQYADEFGLPWIELELPDSLLNEPIAGDLQRSDHAAFWEMGYPGIMLTDSANFRNTHYHCAAGPDTADRLSIPFAVQVVKAVVGAVATELGLKGCSEDDDGGGEGGTAGGGGAGGEAGTGGSALSDCLSVQDGAQCQVAGTQGYCFSGTCGVIDCSDVEDGTGCINPKRSGTHVCAGGSCVSECTVLEEGSPCDPGDDTRICVDGYCGVRCENDVDCSDYNDCTTETCLRSGLCENRPMQDGNPCAGGTCQSGECALETSTLPCTEEGIRNALSAGGGPYTFDCEGLTTVEGSGRGYLIEKDVTLDGEGDLEVDNYFAVYQAGVRVNLIRMAARGIFNDGGTLTLTSSTVSGGQITSYNGALTLIDSTVEDGCGGIFSSGPLTLVASTVFGNRCGAGIDSIGPLTLINSTVSGNGSAVVPVGGIIAGGEATLINTTVAGNLGRDADIDADGAFTAMNSIVDGTCLLGDETGIIVSSGFNIESPGNTCGFGQPTDRVNVTAEQLNLGPLQDNGGPTMTHALLPGSVAIDQIPEADCVNADGAPLTTDQRGEPRPVAILGAEPKCDVGAFEVQP